MFVRISIGSKTDGTSVYRLCEIIGIDDAKKSYKFSNKDIKKALKVRHGKRENIFDYTFVSNNSIKEEEFDRWKYQLKKDDIPIISGNEAMRRRKYAYKLHTTFKYDDDIVDKTLEDKLKNRSMKGMNPAQMKVQMIYLLQSAELTDNQEKINDAKQMLKALSDQEIKNKSKKQTEAEVAAEKKKDRKLMVDPEQIKKIAERELRKEYLEEQKKSGRLINNDIINQSDEQILDPFKRKATQINTAQVLGSVEEETAQKKKI